MLYSLLKNSNSDDDEHHIYESECNKKTCKHDESPICNHQHVKFSESENSKHNIFCKDKATIKKKIDAMGSLSCKNCVDSLG